MEILLIITLMLFATVVIVAISDRFGLPWPVLITLVAASAFFFPSLPLRDDAPDFPATTVVGTGTPYKLGRDPFAMDDRGQLIRVAGIG